MKTYASSTRLAPKSMMKYILIAIVVSLILTIFFLLCYKCVMNYKSRQGTADLKHFAAQENKPIAPETSTAKSKIEELRTIFQERCSLMAPEDSRTLFGKMCSKIDKIKISEDKQSYTINKEKIYLCLTDETKNFYSNNMLIYVLLHEFAHTLSKSVGHTDEFHEIFEELLKEAISKNLYDPNEPIDPQYCKHNKKQKME